MMIIHVNGSSRKKAKKKPGWKQAEESYNNWLKSHGIDPAKKPKKVSEGTYVPPSNPYRRETPKIQSLNSSGGWAAKKEPQKYTGTLIKGIATMHKSNAIPIISQEQAEEVAKMRRG